MKKLITATLAVLALASCTKEKKQGNLEITGNVKGLRKGMLYLKKMSDTTLVTIDTVAIDGNSGFDTSVTIAEPEMLYLFLDRGKTNSLDNSLVFFAEPGKMNIDTDLETFYAKATITGSKNQQLYDEYKKVKSRYQNQQLDLTQKRLDAFKNKTAVSPEENAAFESAIKRKYLFTVNFALNNKDHEVAPFVTLSDIPDATLKYLDTIQKSMTPKIAKSKYGKLLSKYVAERHKAEDTVVAGK